MKTNRHRRGFINVWVVLLGFLFIGMVGLAIDLAYLVLVRQQMQNTADASALSGAWKLSTMPKTQDVPAVVAKAQTTAAANKTAGQTFTLAGGDVALGRYTRPTTLGGTGTFGAPPNDGDLPYNAVSVVANRSSGSASGPINLLFGPMMGVSTANLSVSAIAMVSIKYVGVIVLDPSGQGALNFTGTGSTPKLIINDTLTGGNAGIMVNSTNASAATWSGNPTMIASDFYLANHQTSASAILNNPATETIHYNAKPVADPFASLAAPAKGPTSTLVNGSWTPGYHPSGIPNGAVLAAGVHYVDGGITNSFDATAGSLVYVGTGSVTLKGNDQIKINPLTDSASPYKNFGLWIANGDLNLGGTTDIANNGYLYIPNGSATLSGNPTSVGNGLIVRDVSITGNSQILVNTKHDFPLPPTIFLVR